MLLSDAKSSYFYSLLKLSNFAGENVYYKKEEGVRDLILSPRLEIKLYWEGVGDLDKGGLWKFII